MKQHLPITIFAILMGNFVALSAEIPDEYKHIHIKEPDTLSNYITDIDNSKCAFLLDSDIISSNTRIEGGNLIFTSENKQHSIDFTNENGRIFSQPENLIFKSLYNISFQNTKSWAISASGGSIYTTSAVSMIQNLGIVDFSHNCANAGGGNVTAQERVARGGAIYSSGVLTLKDNTAGVRFVGNSAFAEYVSYYAPYKAYGGSIYTSDKLIINNNGNVEFIKNYARAANSRSTPIALGGAIYSTGSISIVGNESVIFEKNYEDAKNYRLRSIYMATNSSDDNLSLAAKTGGHITIFDSVYMSNYTGAIVSFNANYEDSQGSIQKANGDIIFSGKYTEEHLKEIKGSTAATSTEITNSRTSELLNTVNLYGGTLRVEDKAVLKTHDLNVVSGSNATMKVTNATVNAGSYNVTVGGTGRLEMSSTDGSSTLTTKNIYIEKDGTLSAVNEVTPDEVITLAAAETVSIYNEKLGGIINGNVDMAAGSTYQADGAHLSVKNGTLTFNATSDEKINLVLTLQAQYETDSQVLLFTDVKTVEFILDNATANIIGESIILNAADYFCGDWINENTELVYDGSFVYVTGVNQVIPEPATATLSLLALAALAARRRRRE